MKTLTSSLVLSIVSCVLVAGGQQAFAAGHDELEARVTNSTDTLVRTMSVGDTAIPADMWNHADCVLVIPNLIKAGFIFGGTIGYGVASCRTPDGWSVPSFTNIEGASFGFQAGVESTAAVLVFTRPGALDMLSRPELHLGVEASAALGPVGRDAVLSEDLFLKSEIFSYAFSGGAYAGATIDGAILHPKEGEDADFYGMSAGMLLQTASAPNKDPGASHLSDLLNQYAPNALAVH